MTDAATTPADAPSRLRLTDLTILLDRSGSMKARRAVAMSGFNDLLVEQRTLPDRARLTLTQFDHLYEPGAVGKRLRNVPLLDESTYVPRGMTALLDAIGRTIKDTEQRLEKRAAKRARNGKPAEDVDVVITVITDGLENASSFFSHEDIKAMIEAKEAEDDWTFTFMGTTWESVRQSERFGMKAAFSVEMGERPEDYAEAKRMMSRKFRTVRERTAFHAGSVKDAMRFTEEERAQLGQKSNPQ